jgi:two-component system OmpR family sensor kinase
MRRPLVRWLLSGLPLLVAVIAALLLQNLATGLPIVHVRADPGSVLIFFGALGSLGWLAYLTGGLAYRAYCQRLLEDERQVRDETHRRFLLRLDHELKNPLTAMRAALANLDQSLPSEERERAVQDVQLQTERLSRLVGDLRKLAELEERPIEQLSVDLGELLNEVVESAQSHPAYAKRQVHLVISQVPWPLPPVTGDRDLLGLALYNLVDNALKFTGPQDTVEVRALEDGRSLVVEVADTGPGIPLEDQERIFEELYRGSNARGFEGSGLGLALVQRIVARHGGSVSVRSRPAQPGNGGTGGTVFTLRLPQS